MDESKRYFYRLLATINQYNSKKNYFLYSEYVSAFSTTSSSVHAYMCVDPEVNQYAGWAYIGTVCSSNKKLRSLLSEWHYSDASSGVVRNKKKIKLLCIALGCMLYILTSFTDGLKALFWGFFGT